MIRWLIAAISLVVPATAASAAEPIDIGIGYLGRAGIDATLSPVEQPAADDGLAGARLAFGDYNNTGKFLNQDYALH